MGQRFQVYVNYGKEKDHLFAMHLQWCWGPFSIVRAHQISHFIDGSREHLYNPFGLGGRNEVGGVSFDGRREDLYLLKALTEVNLTSSSIVEGHDLMQEENSWDELRFERGEISSFPLSVRIDPLAQDNNDGFFVVQANEDETKYAFCKDVCDFEPVTASEYMSAYQDDIEGRSVDFQEQIAEMISSLDRMPLLSRDELTDIFEKSYSKELNIENFKAPEREQKREQPLSELVEEAKDRAAFSQSSHSKPHGTKSNDREL